MIKAPSPHNDTTRTYPRTLREAFPSCPQWQEEPPLVDRVVIYLGCFVAGYLLALITTGN